jgi:hypothetical protein
MTTVVLASWFKSLISGAPQAFTQMVTVPKSWGAQKNNISMITGLKLAEIGIKYPGPAKFLWHTPKEKCIQTF